MSKKKSRLPLLLILMSFIVYAVSGQNNTKKLSADQWSEDLRFLNQKINKEFAGFTPQSQKAFKEAVDQLEQNIPSLSSTAIIMEMNKMVAMLKDGHTELNLLQSAIGFRRMPLVFYYFGQDLHVIFASPEYKALLGKKVKKVNGHTLKKVHDMILPFLAHDNEVEFLLEVPNYMTATDLLAYLQLTDTPDHIKLTVEDAEGSVEEVTIASVNRSAYAEMDWVSARENNKRPLYLTRNTDYYWYTYLEEEHSLYFKCNRMNNQKGKPSLPKIIDELFETLDDKRPEKLIIDLRLNRGGNYKKGLALIKEIKSRPYINQKGKVFVLIDRYTFSAASAITGFLKRETKAIVAGEPGRSRPNGADNYEPYTLPNSKINFGVTNRMKDLYPELGDAPFIPVDLPASTPLENYLKGEDLVLKEVLNY